MLKALKKPWVWLVILSAVTYLGYTRVYQPIFAANVQTTDGKPIEFYIYTGWDYRLVGQELLKQKLITDVEAFHWVAEQMNYPRHVYPGRYLIEDGMSTRELVTLLRSGKQTPISFTFVKCDKVERAIDRFIDDLSRTKYILRAIDNNAI